MNYVKAKESLDPPKLANIHMQKICGKILFLVNKKQCCQGLLLSQPKQPNLRHAEKPTITPFSLETPKEATPNELPSMPLAKSYPRHTPVTVPCYKLQCSLKSLYMRNIYA